MAKETNSFEKDLQKVVDILQARGITTAVIGMGSDKGGAQQVIYGEADKMLILCASIMRRISDLTDTTYEETADVVKVILLDVMRKNRQEANDNGNS